MKDALWGDQCVQLLSVLYVRLLPSWLLSRRERVASGGKVNTWRSFTATCDARGRLVVVCARKAIRFDLEFDCTGLLSRTIRRWLH